MSRTYKIGLLCSHYFEHFAFSIVTGMVSYAAQRPDLRFVDLRFRGMREATRLLRTNAVDGLVVTLNDAQFKSLSADLPEGIPIVNTTPDALAKTIPSVCLNQETLAVASIEYFAALGHRCVGAVGRPSGGFGILSEHVQRAARERDLNACVVHIETAPKATMSDAPSAETLQAIHKMPRPVGLVTTGGYSAMFVDRAAHHLGYHVPDDIAILSSSDDEICLFGIQPISAFASQGNAMGRIALRLVYEALQGKALPAGRVTVPPGAIIERHSTGFAAGMDDGLKAALRFIRNHACEGIQVADIVRHVRIVSRSRLYQLFQKHLGRSPAAEIRRTRLEVAKQHLTNGDYTISEISDLTGFDEHAQFTNAFTRAVGMPPSVWRRQQRQD